MKFRLFFLSIFVASFCNAQKQKDTSGLIAGTAFSVDTTFASYLKDSCWSEHHIDTIQVDFVIIVDKNNFVKKERVPFIVDKYDIKNCKMTIWDYRKLNETFLLNGKPTEVLLYRRKDNLPGSLNVGNSR